MLMIALLTMLCAVVAHHLGLPQAVAEVGSRVAGCPKCLSFWATLWTVVLLGGHPLLALALALAMAYLSHWTALLLGLLNNLYNLLWQKINRE